MRPAGQAEEESSPGITPGALAKKFAMPAVLVAALFAVACRLLDMRHVGELLLQARPWPLVGLLLLYVGSMMLHALRMWVLLRRAVPFSAVFHADMIGNMINSILPLRAGEFAFALLLSRRVQGGGAAALSNTFVDRLLALISILAIFLAFLPHFAPQSAAGLGLARSGLYYTLAFGGIVLAMFLVIALEGPLVALAHAVLSRLPLPARFSDERMVGRLRACIGGLRVLFHLRTSLPVFLLALATWAGIIGAYYCGMLAVMPQSPFIASVFVTFLTTVGIMLVPTPSGIGTVHGISVLALSMFGIGAEQALAFAILSHALITSANIALGILSAYKQDFRWDTLLRRTIRD